MVAAGVRVPVVWSFCGIYGFFGGPFIMSLRFMFGMPGIDTSPGFCPGLHGPTICLRSRLTLPTSPAWVAHK
jgi:hypothetical protein